SKRLPDGGPVYGAKIRELAVLAQAGDFEKGHGSSQKIDVSEAYIERLLQDYQGTKGLNVVWDNGNGAAGDILERLTKRLTGEHTILFGDIDGNFPNHHPDPTVPENLADLQRAVVEKKADMGIAFDGDADRIGAVDCQGRILAGDQLLALYAREVLQDHKGATIIADVKASQVLFDSIAKDGGKPLMWKTGHSLIKVKMSETKSPLAGEMSGHIFFADKYYGFDDALYCGIRLISLVESFGVSLADLRDTLPETFSTPEIRFDVDEARKFKVVEEVKARLQAQQVKVNDTDGVRVLTDDGWWLLRASNTQAVLVARAEAKDLAGLDRLKAQIVEALKSSGIKPPAF
ncbi:MAG TPA: phosphomannomutase, partial [Rhodospirillaceae bacterium]|nr:phosphomannomutase [Rhodospirillaceae bacterium]